MKKWICDEDDASFSGDMSQSHTNDGAQMDNKKRTVRRRIWEQSL